MADRAGALVVASPHPSLDLLWTPLAGRPLLAWSVAACEATPEVAETLLLVPENRLADADALAESQGWKRIRVLPGAVRMGGSADMGLRALDPTIEWVVILDAACPLVTHTQVRGALDLARRTDTNVIMGEPVKETVKRVSDGLVVETLSRERMVRAQTPYVFNREQLQTAHASVPSASDYADEVMLALAAHMPLHIFPGSHDTFRVTSAADLAVAETLLAARESPL